jgi:hypothetical protein
MEIKEVYKKIDNLLALSEKRDLSKKEESKLKNLKKLRNILDPECENDMKMMCVSDRKKRLEKIIFR